MTLVTRTGKGSPLTIADHDGNLQHFVDADAALQTQIDGKAASNDARFGVATSLAPSTSFGFFATDSDGVASVANSDVVVWQDGTTHVPGSIVVAGDDDGEVELITGVPSTPATGKQLLDGDSDTDEVTAQSFGEAVTPKTGNIAANVLTIDLTDDDAGINWSETILSNTTITIPDIPDLWLGAHMIRIILTSSGTAHTLGFTDSTDVKFVDAVGTTRPTAMPATAGHTLVVVLDLLPGATKKRAVIVNAYTIAAT